MLRTLAVSLLLLGLTGCALSRPPQRQKPPAVSIHAFEDAVPASALVFAPPITSDQPPLALDRADRDATAFVGYEETIEQFFYLRVDDRQTNDFRDRFERRGVSETVKVLTR